ncbi:transposase [Azospirillum brasilense]|nr:transposase [Azospirillum brasilense]
MMSPGPWARVEWYPSAEGHLVTERGSWIMGPVPMAIPMAVPMTIQRVEGITGLERRRQFTDEEKLRLVEEAFQPGVKATEVARRLGVDVSLLYRWRRQFFGQQPRLPAFLPITVATDAPAPEEVAEPTAAPPAGLIEVEFATARLRITGPVDPALVGTVIAALSGRSA